MKGESIETKYQTLEQITHQRRKNEPGNMTLMGGQNSSIGGFFSIDSYNSWPAAWLYESPTGKTAKNS